MSIRASTLLGASLLFVAATTAGAICGDSSPPATATPTPTIAEPAATATQGVSPSPQATVATSTATAALDAATPATPQTPVPTSVATMPPTIAPTATPVPTVTPEPTATPTLPPPTPTFPATATPSPTPAPFVITRVAYPSSVQSGGPKGALTVYWSGQPQFPVTMVYQMYSCPENANCTEPTMMFQTAANPLVFPDSVWCAGFDKTVTFGYQVVLIDANNRTTNAFKAPFTCTVP